MTDKPPDNPEIDEPQLRHRPAKRDQSEVVVQGLLESDPKAFLNLLGIPIDGPVTVIETGIFPHILPIDRVLRVASSKPWIAVVGLATSPDPDIAHLVEITFASVLHNVPIEAAVVLVRPEAEHPNVSGEHVERMPDGEVYLQFRYHVVRAWERPADRPFDDDNLDRSGLSELIAELRERAAAGTEDVSESVICLVFGGRGPRDLRAMAVEMERLAPCVLLSLNRREDPRVVSHEEGCAVMRMKLYQAGKRKFGEVDERIAAAIGAITSARRLSDLDSYLAWIDSRDLPITSWDELLAWREPAD